MIFNVYKLWHYYLLHFSASFNFTLQKCLVQMRFLKQKLGKFHFILCLKQESGILKNYVYFNLHLEFCWLNTLNLGRLVLQAQNTFPAHMHWGIDTCGDSVHLLPQVRALVWLSSLGHTSNNLHMSPSWTCNQVTATCYRSVTDTGVSCGASSQTLHMCEPRLAVPCFRPVCRVLFWSRTSQLPLNS